MSTQYDRIRPIVFQKAPEIKQVRSNSLAVRSSPSKQSLDLQLSLSTSNKEALQELQNLRRQFISESCHHSSNKENSNKKFSFKVDEIQYLKNRIQQLEQQNINYVQENKKLAHVLDQQIQLNTQLQEQKKLCSSNEHDFKGLTDQLSIYKKVVQDLENKIQMVIQENNKLNEINEALCNQESKLKNEIEKLRENPDPRKNRKFDDISHQQRTHEDFNNKREALNELECQNQYLTQVLQIDQQKMQNLEEKLALLSRENQRLQDMVKNRFR